MSIKLLLFVKKKKNPKNNDHKANVECCERTRESPLRHLTSNRSCFMGLTSASLNYDVLSFNGMTIKKASASFPIGTSWGINAKKVTSWILLYYFEIFIIYRTIRFFLEHLKNVLGISFFATDIPIMKTAVIFYQMWIFIIIATVLLLVPVALEVTSSTFGGSRSDNFDC